MDTQVTFKAVITKGGLSPVSHIIYQSLRKAARDSRMSNGNARGAIDRAGDYAQKAMPGPTESFSGTGGKCKKDKR